jgi:hypothetical protein
LYFRFTLFNAITLLIAALTVFTIVQRLRSSRASNSPLIYFALLAAYAQVFRRSLNWYGILAGMACAVLLRFACPGARAEKVLRAAEFGVLGYVLIRCAGLILMWRDYFDFSTGSPAC